jgi:hypothetical protein
VNKRAMARTILDTLGERNLRVTCECGRQHETKWIDVQFSKREWVAVSEVECECGEALYSYIGDHQLLQKVQQSLGGVVVQ